MHLLKSFAVAFNDREIIPALADENIAVDLAGVLIADFGLAVVGNGNLGMGVDRRQNDIFIEYYEYYYYYYYSLTTTTIVHPIREVGQLIN